MLNRNAFSVILLLYVLQFGCSVSSNTAAEQNAQGLTNTSNNDISATKKGIRPLTSADRKDFFGCWSSGNGMVLRITENEVFLSTNDFSPVKYTEQGFESGPLIIHLQDRPSFYYLQEYISLEFDQDADPVSEFPLVIRHFKSLDDLQNGNTVGVRAWVRSDCKTWFPNG